MCGIIGISNKENVSKIILRGIMSIQHRGQDATGILTNKDNEFYQKKVKGKMKNLFKNNNGSFLEGNIGIGHTRYSTMGSDSLEDLQPIFVNSTKKISMAHNGNVINYFELKEELKKQGDFLSTKSDIEVILKIFAKDYEKNQDFFKASKEVLETVKGAYSIVGIIGNEGMIAIRDPKGIRPLVLGKKNDSYILSSESVVLQTVDYEYIRDIEPGEAILIKNDGTIKSKIILQEKRAHCMFEWVYFARPDSMIEGRSVYKARLSFGTQIAKQLENEKIDVVIPVPDTGRSAALKISEVLKIPFREGLIKNRYVERTFILNSQSDRKKMALIKYNPIISVIENNVVAVVDDSIVRGITSKRIVSILRKANPKKIIFISYCPPIKNPCFYGIDFPTEKELIASDKDFDKIREYIGADKLVYGTIENLKKSIKRPLCTACLDGNYPVPLSENQKKLLSNDKKLNRTNGIEKIIEFKKLNILVIGSGGREHAIILKVKKSNKVKKIFSIPGNPGINEIAESYNININDNESLANFVINKKIDLTIVGPEEPLANGVVDYFEKKGLKIFGPNKKATMLESSKIFSKFFMKKYSIPTPNFETFSNFETIETRLQKMKTPIVLKADGFAKGKGVKIAKTIKEAVKFAEECLVFQKFGESSKRILVEEYLIGEEASFHILISGQDYEIMAISKDHKQVFEGNEGNNTGGMGAYSPTGILNGFETEIKKNILEPLMTGLKNEKINYKGVLFIGLMKTQKGIQVLEFNCRLGDPEAQVILPKLENDFVQVVLSTINNDLKNIKIKWNDKKTICVVLTSGGYPEKFEKGKLITGLDLLKKENTTLIHHGTGFDKEDLVTNGGRVLSVVTEAYDMKDSIKMVYDNVSKINFENSHFRQDIGFKEYYEKSEKIY